MSESKFRYRYVTVGTKTAKRNFEEDNCSNPSEAPKKDFDLEEELESLLEFTGDNQAPNQTKNNATNESISEETPEGDFSRTSV